MARSFGTSSRSAMLLASGLAGMGTLHFLKPKPFDAIVPRRIPGSARLWTRLSGVAELACAAAVAHPRTRRVGARATAVLFVAVFPANLKMARDARRAAPAVRYGSWARLPLQIPLIRWAWKVGATASTTKEIAP